MARKFDRAKAIQLRLQGESYSQIKQKLGVNKGTLSYWLHNYPLSEQRIRELRDKNPQRIERYRVTRARQKKERFEEIYRQERRNNPSPRTKREFFIAGLFLYWGEGAKTKEAEISLSNTNPSIVIFFIKWLTKCLGIPKEKVRIKLQLYSDMSVEKEVKLWSQKLSIPKKQFRKSYIKTSSSQSITFHRGFGHGTCNVVVGDADLGRRIFANLRIIEDRFKNC